MRHNITRRHFLKGSIGALGAATVAACGPSAGKAEVIIRTAGWPINPMPTSEAIAANPALGAYADALQTWMNRNTHVRIERIETAIWEPQALITAIASDTAPTYFLSSVVGNWSASQARSAFKQGLMADLTEAIADTRLSKESILPVYREAWEQTGNVGGQIFHFPIDTALEDVMFYRRDLFAEAGLPEPSPNWTWEEYFELMSAAKKDGVSGFGAPWFFVGDYLKSYGFDLLTNVPTPQRGWHWQRNFDDSRWTDLTARYREVLFEPGNAYTDTAFKTKREYRDAFHAGVLATVSSNIMSPFKAAASETSVSGLGRRNGKSFEETIGFVPMPRGDGLVFGGINFAGGVALPPSVTPQEAQIAVDLVDYMFFGEAYDAQKVATYELTGDLQAVYDNPLPLDGRYQLDGVPGSFTDAWGERILQEIEHLTSLPQPSHRVQTPFFAPEENALPDVQVIDDLWSKMTYVKEVENISAEFDRAAAIWNQQSDSFTSSTSATDFVDSAQKYYAEIDRMLQASSPEFYANRYVPFYNQHVKPALS